MSVRVLLSPPRPVRSSPNPHSNGQAAELLDQVAKRGAAAAAAGPVDEIEEAERGALRVQTREGEHGLETVRHSLNYFCKPRSAQVARRPQFFGRNQTEKGRSPCRLSLRAQRRASYFPCG